MHRVAQFNYRGLGKLLRGALERDGRGWRVISREIGVTPTDLSRLSAGQPTSAHKVIAVCDWLHCPLRLFYSASNQVFHEEHTETARPPKASWQIQPQVPLCLQCRRRPLIWWAESGS